MSTFRLFNHQARRMVTAGMLLFATLVPSLVPALVSAATVTERSVALSSSVKSATADYTVNFKGVAASTGAFVVEFCTDAAIGTACTPPTNIDTTNVDTSGSDTVTPINTNKAVKVVLATPKASGVQVSVELTGITNPSTVGTFYARIVTYEDGTTNYHYTAADNLGTHLDDGSVAISTTDGFGVSGSVLETLSFCASGSTFDANGCAGSVTSPDVSLGAGGVLGSAVSNGTIYSQVSTNAAHGAVVNLKSSAAGCGGLMLEGASGAAACGIGPMSPAGDITADAAKFGLKLGTIDNGTGTIGVSHGYSTGNYYMNYPGNDNSGVTSTYGDTIYDTSGGPISKGTVPLIFGANISPDTPAGNYSAALNLIATGTF